MLDSVRPWKPLYPGVCLISRRSARNLTGPDRHDFAYESPVSLCHQPAWIRYGPGHRENLYRSVRVRAYRTGRNMQREFLCCRRSEPRQCGYSQRSLGKRLRSGSLRHSSRFPRGYMVARIPNSNTLTGSRSSPMELAPMAASHKATSRACFRACRCPPLLRRPLLRVLPDRRPRTTLRRQPATHRLKPETARRSRSLPARPCV